MIFDSDSEGRAAARRLEEAFGGAAPSMMLGTPIALNEATIEDLIPRETYVKAVNTSAGHSIVLNDQENQAVLNVQALEKAYLRLNLGPFGVPQKTAAALALISEWGADPAKLPARTKPMLVQSSMPLMAISRE